MRYIALVFCAVFSLSFSNGIVKQAEIEETNKINDKNVQAKTFEDLFRQAEPDEFRTILSVLAGQKDHAVITAGTASHYNSMAASWEFLGHYFGKPTVFCLLGAERYTLELIEEQQTYTVSFFPEQFSGEVFAFGRTSGRDSDKMKKTTLTHVLSPSGNCTYQEAEIVVECQLFEITTVNPDDFFTEDAKKFVENGYLNGGDYHKLVFGTVTNVWVKNNQ